jgi:PAS domain S-box-containing protein
LPAHIAITNQTGLIVAVNQAWRAFAQANAATLDGLCEGSHYFEVCERAAAQGDADALALMRGVRAILAAERAEYTLEYTCHAPSEPRWFVARVVRCFDQSEPYLLFVHENVTERVRALQQRNTTLERAIKERTDEFFSVNTRLTQTLAERVRSENTLKQLSLAIEQSADCVVITNKDGIIEYVNPAFERLTGYTPDEALGRTPRILRSNKYSQKFYQTLWATILAGEVFRKVIVNRKKYGELYYEDKIITPIKDAAGQITHFVSTGRDVTARRKIQRRLRVHEAQLQRRMQESEALARISGALLEASDVQHIFQLVADTAYKIIPRVQRAVIHEVSTDGVMLRPMAVAGLTERGAPTFKLRVGEGIAGLAMTQGQVINVADTHQDPRYLRVGLALDMRSLLVAPLQSESRPLGTISIQSSTPSAFSTEDERLLTQLGVLTAIAVQKARLHEAEHKRRLQAQALTHFAARLNAQLESHVLLDMICAETAHALQTPIASILLYDEAHDDFRVKAIYGLSAGQPHAAQPIPRALYEKYEHMIGRVVEVADVRALSELPDVELYQTLDIRSVALTTLVRDGRLLGALGVATLGETRAFHKDETALLQTLADQASQAIVNARLFEQERRRLQEALALHHVTQAISASLDEQALMLAVIAAITEVAHYQFVAIYYLEAAELHLKAQHGYEPQHLRAVVPIQQGVIGRVTRTGEPVLVTDVTRDPDYLAITPEVRALIAVPIKQREVVCSVLLVESSAERRLDQNDVTWLTSVGQQLSVALENAWLYAEQKALLREHEHTQAQLIHSEKMSALGRLVASLAHEINNPLQSVQGCLTLAQETLANLPAYQNANHFLNVANGEVQRIATILARMKDFYRPSRKSMLRINAHELLESVLALMSKQLQHGHVIVKQAWGQAIPELQANPDHLKQVFLNLILNAIDAMPRGGILTIASRLGTLRGRGARSELAAVLLDFSDTGVGIPKHLLPHLFEPFFTTKEHGSGLGLSISYGIIQAHHGTIHAQSEVGVGTTFTLTLPINQPQ